MSGPIRNQEDLDRCSAAGTATLYPARLKILIGSATCGIAAGARDVEAAAKEAVARLKLDAVVTRTGCIGFCQREPLLDLIPADGPRVSYANMTAEKTKALLEAYAAKRDLKPATAMCRFTGEEHVALGTKHEYSPLPPGGAANSLPSPSGRGAGGEGGSAKNGKSAVGSPHSNPLPEGEGTGKIPEWSAVDFYRRQSRIILRNCGSIDPLSLDEAIARGAYRGALRALTGMKSEAVIDEVLNSGLRGRGGAGFPTGRKWQTARQVESDVKYVICNADEGDPGAFMDRSVLEGDPHAVIEGMLIGSFAIGASEGYVYVRSEYPLAVSTITHAIRQAEEHGLLGDNIFGSGHSFRIKVRRGAGAFVCGEETSLIASIEGHAGEPRPRPPFPAIKGLWGKPTVINNVKTLASIGPILARGAAWYASQGGERNRGTTVFALVGAVKNTGLVEIPLGMTLREMVFEIGGGMRSKRPIKAVQTGGPSGGCLPASLLDLPIDYEKLAEAGSMMGSGGMIVLDSSTCMVDLARFFLTFTSDESCGKCTPCREGTKHMLQILTRICEGRGVPEDIELLERLARTVKSASLCGLGSTAPNPVLTALRYFRDEFEAHIRDKKCPAGVCRNLIRLRVDPAECIGCERCKSACAVGAITGERKAAHRIDDAKCTRCGACRSICPSEAIISE
jgi:NADH:ubiquinone oxidoreductase subunit F (NADH-binding)/(2Fe-2S) ferredoxin/Pyruvate/2-oxoacid:ferredoxin oxidoreductase delta subunit